MKIIIYIICFTLLLTFKTSAQTENKNIQAVILYLDVNKEIQSIDFNMFDPNNKSYIGTNDYIITSNAGVSIPKATFESGMYNEELIKETAFIFNNNTLDKSKKTKNDAFEITKEKRVQDYLNHPENDWYRDDELEININSLYALRDSYYNNSHMYAQYNKITPFCVKWTEEQTELAKKHEILLNKPIKNYPISDLHMTYINVANKIIQKNKDARIWFSLPRYDYYLPYSKVITHKYFNFLASLIDEFSKDEKALNFMGFCFDTELLVDCDYREFDTTTLVGGQSVVSYKYYNSNKIKGELDYGNEMLNSLVSLSSYIHKHNKTFIWISSFENGSTIKQLSDYALEVVTNQTNIFDYVFLQQSFDKENTSKSIYQRAIVSGTKTKYKKISNTIIGFEYDVYKDDIDNFEALINSKNNSFVVYFGKTEDLLKNDALNKIQHVFKQNYDLQVYKNDFLNNYFFVSHFKKINKKDSYKKVPLDSGFILYKYVINHIISDYDNSKPVKRYSSINQEYYNHKKYVETYLIKNNETIKISDFELKHDKLNAKHQLNNSLLLYLEISDFAREYYDFNLVNYELKPHIFIDGSNYRIADFKLNNNE